MGGYIMQTQAMSVNDGDGLRTTVFFAGCPLSCAWCCNPEGKTAQNPMTRWVEADEVLREVRRYAVFYRFSGGGITFSGGEATAQPEFLAELTDALYDEGYDLALESCGAFDFARLLPTLKKMNQVFLDLKLMDDARHTQFTGQHNRLILENITKAAEAGLPLVVRIPVIMGVNGSDADMAAAFAFLSKHAPHAGLELLPYHRFGEEKYAQLALPLPPADFGVPTDAQLGAWRDMAREYGLRLVSYR